MEIVGFEIKNYSEEISNKEFKERVESSEKFSGLERISNPSTPGLYLSGKSQFLYKFNDAYIVLTDSGGGYEEPFCPLVIIADDKKIIGESCSKMKSLLGLELKKITWMDVRLCPPAWVI